jgi:hypothetical protein
VLEAEHRLQVANAHRERRAMATLAGIVAVVTGFSAALLLYEATLRDARNVRRMDVQRRAQMRKWGLVAAAVAVIAAYVAAVTP